MAKGKSGTNGDSIWDQSSKDVNFGGDKETQTAFEQMTGDGLVHTETGNKNGGTYRNKPKYGN
jgi:hypothetical protein